MTMNDILNKGKIIDIVAEGTGLTKNETAAVVDGFLATISWALTQGQQVALRGFGAFRPAQRAGRHFKNPHTGEAVFVGAHRTAGFRPAKELRHALNQSHDSEEPTNRPSNHK